MKAGGPLSRIRVVLSRPSHPGNIGAAARAMKTMGLARLYLVRPKSFPHADARAMAAGARDVFMVCVHPVFSRDAAERLAALPVKQFIVTDTVPIPRKKLRHFGERIKILSIAPLLGEVIVRAHEGRSVGEMFNE